MTALSENKITVDAFTELENGYFNLASVAIENLDVLRGKLTGAYNDGYLNLVDYRFEGIEPRRSTERYLPSDLNGLLAQYYYI